MVILLALQSDLRLSTVHKQFGACNVTRIIGGEKRHGLRDFVRLSDPMPYGELADADRGMKTTLEARPEAMRE
jgi:hypothetical protein